MKRLFFLLAMIAICFQASAQLLDFGVKAGANYPTLKLDGSSRISDITTTSGGGFHAGGMLRVNILFLYVQPELIYTKTSSDYSFKVDGMNQNGTYDMQRLDVPIPVGFKLGPAAIFAGPVASFNLNSPSDIFNDSYKEATWGYQIGAGVKLFSFLAEVKYEGPFNDYAKSAQVAGEFVDLDARQNMWIISVGYFF